MLFVVYWRIWWQELQFGGSDIEEVLRYRDGYCLLSGEAININGLTRLPKLLYEIKTF